MGIDHLHNYIEKTFPEDEKVDLIRIARLSCKDTQPVCRRNGNIPQLSLVVDGESALNRLYGGYFPDWICGGQWNHMRSFIDDLVGKLNESNIEIVVFFSGALELQRMSEWTGNQTKEFIKIQKILRHINWKNVPPPKAWWTPPVGIRTAIRMMLRQANVNVIQSTDDHRQEIATYCRENNFHGIISDDMEFLAFNPPRLFSAHHLKLTYKGTLESKEYLIADILEKLNFTIEKLCLLISLLGNFALPESQLTDIYAKAEILGSEENSENYGETVVSKLAKFINTLDMSENLEDVVRQIMENDSDPRYRTLLESLQYYLISSKDGLKRTRSDISRTNENVETNDTGVEPHLNTSSLASENAENSETDKNNMASLEANADNNPEDHKQEESEQSNLDDKNINVSPVENDEDVSIPNEINEKIEKSELNLPAVSHDVMKTLNERHVKGLMTPYLYHILSFGEIKLPVVMEDNKEIPSIHEFYRPIRQMVYAIVFNLNHHKFMASKENRQLDVDIKIKEWTFNADEKVHKPEYVKAEPLGWGVPTIQRLWFGTLPDDRRRRLRAFLTCMKSDVPLIMNYEYVPQQSLFAAVVLRYIMAASDKRILRKQELDAFIVTAIAPESFDPQFTQQLKEPISSRSVQLAALFLHGVEMAILVNDACGAPIPWLMCCPWLFFDGRCFNYMFHKAMQCKNLPELCDNRPALVFRTERMRQAILENLSVQFPRPPVPPSVMLQNGIFPVEPNHQYAPRGMMNRVRIAPAMPYASSNSARGLPQDAGRGKKPVAAKLEVAGTVVSHWANNCSMPAKCYEAAPYVVSQQYGKKKIIRKDKKPGRGRGMSLVNSNSGTNNSEAVNGNDCSVVEEKFEAPVVNGTATELIGEGDASVLEDAASSLVETSTK